MLAAQGVPPSVVEGLLPAGAVVIETADLRPARGKTRTLVLWMRNPKKEVRDRNDVRCADDVYGDNWVGLTSLSVVDASSRRLISTISIQGESTAGIPSGEFRLPFKIRNGYYSVPVLDSEKEGKPRLLYLRDLTGDGIAAEFVLFMYQACGIVATSVFGYQVRSDRVVQYPVAVTEGRSKPTVRTWVWQVFGAEPSKPGQWDYSWNPGHGADLRFRERVLFDKGRQRFVLQHTETPLDLKP